MNQTGRRMPLEARARTYARTKERTSRKHNASIGPQDGRMRHKSVILRRSDLILHGSVQKCSVKGTGSPYSTAERRVRKLIPVLGSQPAGDVSHKPVSRLPLLFARPACMPSQPLRGLLLLSLLGEQRHDGCEQFA